MGHQLIRLAAIFLSFSTLAAGEGRELTVDQARQIVAGAGLNPGTVRQIGDLGRYALRSVEVDRGHRPGEFIIRVRVEALP